MVFSVSHNSVFNAIASAPWRRMAAVALLLAWCAAGASAPLLAAAQAKILPSAAVFAGERELVDSAGKKTPITALAGKPVLLHFWATWCVPCVAELPEVDALAKELEGRATVIAVSLDFQGAEVVERFYKDRNITHLPIYLDKGSVLFKSFKLAGLPATVFLNAKSEEVARASGAVEWKGKAAKDFIETLAPRNPE